LAKGVITGEVPWDMIGIGAAIGVAVIILDELLGLAKKKRGPRLPPLAVGLGIYLPTSTTLMVVVGALVGAWYDRRAERKPNIETTKQLGVQLASGLIVGESQLAVIFAGIVGFTGKHEPIALVGDSFATPSIIIGGVVFAVTVIVLYRWIIRMGRAA
jgi:putative OPT family oligopeptide transporter